MSEGTAGTPQAVARRLLTVVRGEPTQQQLAALVAVVAGRACGSAPQQEAAPSLWSSPADRMRPPLAPGPGAWRASGLPH